MSDSKPEDFVFIIGAMKSGTTSLFEVLGQHPQVCPAKVKEPDFFIKDHDMKSLESYLSLWDWKSGKHKVALESSVAYAKEPFISGVAKRIFESNLGEYRFIYMLRNPLQRIESQIRHGQFAGWGGALENGIPDDVVDFSRYAMQLDYYLKFFPLDRILLVTLEEFRDEPKKVLSRICCFLGIDADFDFQDASVIRNSGEFFNSPSFIARITQNKLSQLLAKKLLPAHFKTRLRCLISRMSGGGSAQSTERRWRLNRDEKQHVLDLLSDDLKRLESEFGIDIAGRWHIAPDSYK